MGSRGRAPSRQDKSGFPGARLAPSPPPQFCILHFTFCILRDGALGTHWGGLRVALRSHWGCFGRLRSNAEGRMQNAEYLPDAGTGAAFPGILHSSFCLLHSRGGLGVVWYWSGGSLTWLEQTSAIVILTRLAMWLCVHPPQCCCGGRVRLSAPGIDGAGPVQARRVPDVDCVKYWNRVIYVINCATGEVRITL